MNIKNLFKKSKKVSQPKKLNKTTRLYALYGESANLKYLEGAITDATTKINTNTENIQVNKNQIDNLENMINNIPSGVSKDYVDTQDNALSSRINTNTTNITNIQNELSNTPKLEGMETQNWTTSNIFGGGITITNYPLNMFGNNIIQVSEPADDSDAANKKYVDKKTKLSSFSMYLLEAHAGEKWTSWGGNEVRTFHYTTSSSDIYITAPDNIKSGNYVFTVCWVIQFNGWEHRVSVNLYVEDVSPRRRISFNPSFIGFFTAPASVGNPTKLTLHSVIGVRKPEIGD